ncbi:HEPN domain-containing protein [Acinetobacter bereziniae]|uniref:ApeA N-terminal domain 1-containing protein n=1 Tax=Acinetobacter bereziniae TaxID=106648 RepID=UPI002576CE4E|nr:HEPN domain-containing protein [Acinetobacter bereziniae]MDM1784250.1 hypothetical protein [Acinetobacter bereziniae]
MLVDESKFDLMKDYNISVYVMEQNQTYAGRLFLSPSKCTLHVMTERFISGEFGFSKTIKCFTNTCSYILCNLGRPSKSIIYNLEDSNNEKVPFYEYKFDLGLVFANKGYRCFPEKISSIIFSAPIFNKWVGTTKIQHNLISQIHKDIEQTFFQENIEFDRNVNENLKIRLAYILEYHNNRANFNFRTTITPKIAINFRNMINIENINEEIYKFYNLMNFLIGSDFSLNSIYWWSEEFSLTSSSIYIPSDFRTFKNDHPLLPLNPRYLDENFNFPLELFNNYYLLSENDKSLFTKYSRYKNMKSDEEKFLGYFRLLEKLTSKEKSFVDNEELSKLLDKSKKYLQRKFGCNRKNIEGLINRIEKTNKMKYNTSKCIGDFFDQIPQEISKQLLFDKSELTDITKLRNDITHANAYIHDDVKLYNYTKFINALLFLAFIQIKLKIDTRTLIPVLGNIQCT